RHEELLSRLLALPLQSLGAHAVAQGIAVRARIQCGNELPCNAARRGALGKVEVGPAALSHALDETGLGQKLEVPADARLALPQDAGQVLYIELALRQKHQNAQPRRFGGSLEDRNQCRGVDRRWHVKSGL